MKAVNARGNNAQVNQEYLDSDSPAEFVVDHDGEEKSITWLLGQLWTCTDVLPAGYCQQLDLPSESTYAQAVRWIKERPDLYT